MRDHAIALELILASVDHFDSSADNGIDPGFGYPGFYLGRKKDGIAFTGGVFPLVPLVFHRLFWRVSVK